ncbi:MAG: FAD-binding protein [Bacteroidota bacterium]|nr:FAD-binding protein [Bacteroidota bacterium]
MKKTIDLTLSPEEAYNPELLNLIIMERLRITSGAQIAIRPLRRSIDARSRNIKVNVQAEVYIEESLPPLLSYKQEYNFVGNKEQVIIAGLGPAGIFAALRLIELGIKPVIVERGKNVKDRRRDLAEINKNHIVNPDSNYCFGEGGAGTYSDGKLYTRSKKRGDLKRILEILVSHGAPENILVEAHPHIGTNKLPKIIEAMRESILQAGGVILFNTRITDLIVNDGIASGIIDQDGNKIEGKGVILATGHSARDIFEMLHRKKILVEAKPFALGVRIEHAQNLIDKMQYHCDVRSEYLPASSYSLVDQVILKGKARGVFSFCMCPGGFIVPAATAPGEIVVNGMSPSRRDSKYANSGMVVAVELEDLSPYLKHGPLAGMYYQKDIEHRACKMAGGTQKAPAQLMKDFVERKTSSNLLETSYQPGVTPTDMHSVLPKDIASRLQLAFNSFGKKMKGYLTNEAQILGVESRTSSPVKIPRDKDSLEHVQIKGLYPCGEGAGFAGGIVSAAMDGERCAEKIAEKMALRNFTGINNF